MCFQVMEKFIFTLHYLLPENTGEFLQPRVTSASNLHPELCSPNLPVPWHEQNFPKGPQVPETTTKSLQERFDDTKRHLFGAGN